MRAGNLVEGHRIIKFGILFILFCGVFYWITSLGYFAFVDNYTATMLGFLLQLFGLQSTVQGNLVTANGFSVRIVSECSPIFIFILFSSFILAYPTDLEKKAIGLFFGIPSLFTVNVLRLLIVFLTGLRYPEYFEHVHTYFWQTFIIILIFVACLLWLRLVVMVNIRNTPMTFFIRFLAISSIFFLLWLYLDKIYTVISLHIAELLLHWMGYHIHLIPDPNTRVYSSTFNLITFTSLVLATQSMGRNEKIKALIIGLPLMIIIEVIRVVYQFLAHLQEPHAFEIMFAAQHINQYFLPFALWVAFTYKDVFKRAGTQICPICGEEVIGIKEHVRKKHGKKALKKKEVKAVLEMEAQKTDFISMMVEKLRLGKVMEWIRNRLKTKEK